MGNVMKVQRVYRVYNQELNVHDCEMKWDENGMRIFGQSNEKRTKLQETGLKMKYMSNTNAIKSVENGTRMPLKVKSIKRSTFNHIKIAVGHLTLALHHK